MSASQHARISQKNNRTLQRSIRDRYFRLPQVLPPVDIDKKPIDKYDPTTADKKRKSKVTYLLTSIGIIVFFSSWIMWNYLENRIEQSLVNHHEKLTMIAEESTRTKNIDAYNYFVSSGYEAYHAGDMVEARQQFQQAKQIIASGKAANYGLTLALLQQCKQSGENCLIAKEYYDTMVASDMLNEKELAVLKSL